MHIHIKTLKDTVKAILGFFHFRNLDRIKFYHPLNDRSATRSLVYVIIILLGWYSTFFCGGPSIVIDFCQNMQFGFWVNFFVLGVVIFMHGMLCAYAWIPCTTYIWGMVFSKKMCYAYWRMNKHVKFFKENYILSNLRAMKRTDIIRYFEMLRLYLFVKFSYQIHGLNGEIYKKYRGVYLSNEIDKEVRVLLLSISERFFDSNDMLYWFSYLPDISLFNLDPKYSLAIKKNHKLRNKYILKNFYDCDRDLDFSSIMDTARQRRAEIVALLERFTNDNII